MNIYGLLKNPIYQTDWNGISLVEVAKLSGVSLESLADHEFYGSFYRELRRRDFPLGAKWFDAKAKTSERVRIFLDKNEDGMRFTGKALAVGAGLGVVEVPLLSQGYNIDLQECQAESLVYCERSFGGAMPRVYIAPSLQKIPSGDYDAVYLNQVAYALAGPTYAQCLSDAYRLLRPGGRLAIWDPAYRLRAMRSWFRRPHGVFWGWSRAAALHVRLAKAAGFCLESTTALSAEYQPVDKSLLYATIAPSASEQELIFVRRADKTA